MAKATTTYVLGSTWTKVADAGTTFFIQILPGSGQAFYAYKSTSPNATDVGHVLDPGETMTEASIGTHLWMRALGDSSKIAASVGGSATASGTRTTAQYNLTSSWTQVGASGENIEMDVISGLPVRWAYSGAAPSTTDQGHVLYAGQEYIDTAADQNVWARSDNLDANSARSTLVVTRG